MQGNCGLWFAHLFLVHVVFLSGGATSIQWERTTNTSISVELVGVRDVPENVLNHEEGLAAAIRSEPLQPGSV
jgi:hypothetical protein